MNNNETPATPATPAAPTAEAPKPETPAAQPADPMANLTPEQKALMESVQKAAAQTQAAAARAAKDEPWYWSEFSRGVYTGAGVVLLALGGYCLYKKYAGSEETAE